MTGDSVGYYSARHGYSQRVKLLN